MREIMYTEVREEISYACNRRSDCDGILTRGFSGSPHAPDTPSP